MEQRKFFRAMKEVGAYNAYKRNLASNPIFFNINDIKHCQNALEYIGDYYTFDWSATIEGRAFWFEIYSKLRNFYLKKDKLVV